MLDINLIREKPEKVKEGVQKKGVDASIVDNLIKVDQEWRDVLADVESLKSERNKITKQLAKERTDDLLNKAGEIKEKINTLEDKEKAVNLKRSEILRNLPNLPFDDVPEGEDESDNKIIREEGKKPDFDFTPKDHLELGESLGIINVQKASEVSGSRFGYLLGEAALLEFALVRLAYDLLLKEDFNPIIPPVLINQDVLRKWGKGDFIDNEEAFLLPKDNLALAGSSEHTIGPLHMNETFKEKDLPLRYVGFSSCFRREAGSYGKDTRGIIRVHQFDKIEMFSVSHPDKSKEEHEKLLSLQEEIIKSLKLPYRVVDKCAGDMTWVDAKQYDIETWIPSQNSYRETNSASNTTDFQSRGINAKFKTQNNNTEFVHMLNATAIAVGRIIVAILENYQTKEGHVKVPEVLQGYVGKEVIK